MARSKPYELSVRYGATPSSTVIVQSDVAPREPADQPKEFERFKGLTARLIAVPKAEIDEKRERP